jgi:hypothetical protein
MTRKLILALIVGVGMVAIASLFVNRLHYFHHDLKSCFDDAGGLRAGVPVRIAGVDVGTVRSVRANPQNKGCPAEVEMVLATSYEIRVPKDAIAEIETAGLLGEAYLTINTTQASGAPIEDYGYLKSRRAKNTLSPGEQVRAADAALRLASVKGSRKGSPEGHQPRSSSFKSVAVLAATLSGTCSLACKSSCFKRSTSSQGRHTLVTVFPAIRL